MFACLRVKKCTHLLILLPSLSLSPAAPVLDTRSLPARSTRLILLTFSPEFCSQNTVSQTHDKTKYICRISTNEVIVSVNCESGWETRKDWPQTVDHKVSVWQWYWRRHVIDCSPRSCWWLPLCEICSPPTSTPRCPEKTREGGRKRK